MSMNKILGAVYSMLTATAAVLYLFPVNNTVHGILAGVVFIASVGLAYLLGSTPPSPPAPLNE